MVVFVGLPTREVLSIASTGNVSPHPLERFYHEYSLTSILKMSTAAGKTFYEKANRQEESTVGEFILKNGKFIPREEV